MTLDQIFKQNLCCDPVESRQEIIEAILADGEALRELDIDTELMFELDLRLLGLYAKDSLQAASNRSDQHHSEETYWQHAGEHVVNHLIKSVGEWVDAEFEDVDFIEMQYEAAMPHRKYDEMGVEL